MKVTVKLNSGQVLAAKVPFAGADHVVIELSACPLCKGAAPLKVKGANRHHDHDTHYADAIALCCGKPVGTIRVKVDTIFGIEEDRRVLNGRARVY